MKRISLTLVALATLCVGRVSLAQVAPARPAKPVAPAPAPAPTPAPAVKALTPLPPAWPLDEFAIEDMKRAALNMVDAQRPMFAEAARMAAEEARLQADMVRMDADRLRDEVRQAIKADMPLNMSFNYDFNLDAQANAVVAQAGNIVAQMGGDRLDRARPPQGWAQGDPADSLYRIARETLNRGDWGRSARLFADIQKSYPNSVYVTESQYWEAWSRYKIGTTEELRSAAKVLEPLTTRISTGATVNQQGKALAVGRNTYVDDRAVRPAQVSYSISRRTSDNDILALYARINGALAQRGDADAAAKVAKAASTQGATCDQDDITIRTEALNALSQMDPTQALPLLRRVLDGKDDCSSSLRRNAVFMLGRRGDPEATPVLLRVAKDDPNMNVRISAIDALGRSSSDAAIGGLEELLRGDSDEQIQRAAVRALMRSDSPRGRSAMRALIDRKDAPLALRVEAINSFNNDRASADDAAYLRGLFAKADNDQLKMAVLNAVSRMGGPENDQWIMGVARNANESSSVRSNALSRLSRSPTLTTADLSKLYDASADYSMRNRVINMLGSRKEQDATDKLIEIVRTSTDVQSRTQAIVALRDKKDPKATQALMELLDGKRP